MFKRQPLCYVTFTLTISDGLNSLENDEKKSISTKQACLFRMMVQDISQSQRFSYYNMSRHFANAFESMLGPHSPFMTAQVARVPQTSSHASYLGSRQLVSQQNIGDKDENGDDDGQCCPEVDTHSIQVLDCSQALQLPGPAGMHFSAKMLLPRVEFDHSHPAQELRHQLRTVDGTTEWSGSKLYLVHSTFAIN